MYFYLRFGGSKHIWHTSFVFEDEFIPINRNPHRKYFNTGLWYSFPLLIVRIHVVLVAWNDRVKKYVQMGAHEFLTERAHGEAL